MKKIINKKSITLLIIVLIILVIFSIKDFLKPNIVYEIYKVGYIENTPDKSLIKKYNDFLEYIDLYNNKIYDEKGNILQTTTKKIKEKYKDTYFKNNNLAIYYVQTNSGSITINNIKTTIKDNNLKLEYELTQPEIGTMDMNGYMIVVELNKNIKTIS